MTEFHINKESRQYSMTFIATVSTSIDVVCSIERCRRSPYKTCSRYSLTHTVSNHCPASGTQCGKYSYPQPLTVNVLDMDTLQVPIQKIRKWSLKRQMSIQIPSQRRQKAIPKPKRSENTYYNNPNKPKIEQLQQNVLFKQSVLKTANLHI